jgi:hypothetical protein
MVPSPQKFWILQINIQVLNLVLALLNTAILQLKDGNDSNQVILELNDTLDGVIQEAPGLHVRLASLRKILQHYDWQKHHFQNLLDQDALIADLCYLIGY